MTPNEAINLVQNSLTMVMILATPILAVAMIVGLIISLFQAITQIQEMTLTFVPKIVAVIFTLMFLASWMVTKLIDYTHDLITSLPHIIH
jgi:flagellar biosynthetic protein FliQ